MNEIKGKQFSVNPGHNRCKVYCCVCATYVPTDDIVCDVVNRKDEARFTAYNVDTADTKYWRKWLDRHYVAIRDRIRYKNESESIRYGFGEFQCYAGIMPKMNVSGKDLWWNFDKIRICKTCVDNIEIK